MQIIICPFTESYEEDVELIPFLAGDDVEELSASDRAQFKRAPPREPLRQAGNTVAFFAHLHVANATSGQGSANDSFL